MSLAEHRRILEEERAEFQQQRIIQRQADQALLEIHKTEVSMKTALEAKSLLLQGMIQGKATAAEVEQARVEVANLRRQFEQMSLSKDEMVLKVLEAIGAQERRALQAFKDIQESTTAAVTSSAQVAASTVNSLGNMFCNQLQSMGDSHKEQMGQVSESLRGVALAINNTAASNKEFAEELVSTVTKAIIAGFQQLYQLKTLKEEEQGRQMIELVSSLKTIAEQVTLLLQIHVTNTNRAQGKRHYWSLRTGHGLKQRSKQP